MSQFNTILKEEVKEFRQLGHAFLEKKMTAGEFKGKSGGMGVYAQRGGQKFMIRMRTPSGVAENEHFWLIVNYARKYKLENIHFSTRQAIQLHDLDFDPVCDIMEDAIDNGLYTRGGGGNYPRNVALSPLSGVERGEAFDVTPFALMAGNYLLERMTTYHLPRKLKIAFSNTCADSANATLNDVGFVAMVEEDKPYFELYLAGGLGGGPAASLKYPERIEPEEFLYYIEGMIRLFVAEGDYQNKSKARTRFIPRRMGESAFYECYKKHVDAVKAEGGLPTLCAEVDHMVEWTPEMEHPCLIPQKQKNRYSVLIHPENGLLHVKDAAMIAAYTEGNADTEIRLTMNEELIIRNLTLKGAKEILVMTERYRMDLPIEQSVSCIGTPTCQMGVEQSQLLLVTMLKHLKEQNALSPFLPAIHISGCANSCSRHQVSALGFAGRKQRVGTDFKDAFQVYVGGSFGSGNTVLGEQIGIMLFEQIPAFMAELGLVLDDKQMDFRQYITDCRSSFDALAGRYLCQE